MYHISYIISFSIIWFYLLENLGDTGTRNIHALGRDDQLLGTALPDVALGHGDSARLLPYLTMFSSFIISFKYTYIYIYIYILYIYIISMYIIYIYMCVCMYSSWFMATLSSHFIITSCSQLQPAAPSPSPPLALRPVCRVAAPELNERPKWWRRSSFKWVLMKILRTFQGVFFL